MIRNIYIRLLDEGTEVYRPVPAVEIQNKIYQLNGWEIYDPEDELWEFPPGTVVTVEEQNLNGEIVLVATERNV